MRREIRTLCGESEYNRMIELLKNMGFSSIRTGEKALSGVDKIKRTRLYFSNIEEIEKYKNNYFEEN